MCSQDDRLMSPKEVMTKLSISQTTLNRWVREKHLPKPLYLGPRTRRWSEKELDVWIAAQPFR